jgi:ribosomal-protein-alanine N-acetyltransferase
MSLDITTKTKLTIKPISISFNTLNLNEVDSIALLESQSSEHPWSKNQLSESIKNQNNIAYSLSLDEKIIGFVIAMPAVDTADILNIGINPKYQKKGYGKSLFI